MSEPKKIAFFDSGVGGLTVLAEAIKEIPNEQYIYYADQDNIPYGTKSKKEIKRLVLQSTEFLNSFNLKALVVACNTATSVAIKQLRLNYNFPVIGMEPAIKPALKLDPNKSVILTATKKTLKEKKLKKLIKRLNAKSRIQKINLQKLVSFAERQDFNSEEVRRYLEKKFEHIDWQGVSSIVLGCTHFLFFKSILLDIIPPFVILKDGNMGTIKRLKSLITLDENNDQSITYYRSGKLDSSTNYQHFLDYYANPK